MVEHGVVVAAISYRENGDACRKAVAYAGGPQDHDAV
jgi:hypothetical protein